MCDYLSRFDEWQQGKQMHAKRMAHEDELHERRMELFDCPTEPSPGAVKLIKGYAKARWIARYLADVCFIFEEHLNTEHSYGGKSRTTEQWLQEAEDAFYDKQGPAR